MQKHLVVVHLVEFHVICKLYLLAAAVLDSKVQGQGSPQKDE